MKRRTDIIIFMVILFLLSSCSSYNQEKEQLIADNMVKLKGIESLNMEEVDKAVASMQKKLSNEREGSSASVNYRDLFTNNVVMGDSIAAGLEEYNLLNSIQVVAARGRNLDTIDEDIDKVIQLAPSHIFFSYGMNDLAYCRGISDLFISRYEDVIQRIQEGLPKVELHVNAILPIQQHAIDGEPVYGKYTEFNDALKDMCERLEIDFIDNSSIINDNNIAYAYDGIHPVFDFYPYWLKHMAERL